MSSKPSSITAHIRPAGRMRVRGTYLGVAVDKSTRAPDRAKAKLVMRLIQDEVERGMFAPRGAPNFASAALEYMRAGGSRNDDSKGSKPKGAVTLRVRRSQNSTTSQTGVGRSAADRHGHLSEHDRVMVCDTIVDLIEAISPPEDEDRPSTVRRDRARPSSTAHRIARAVKDGCIRSQPLVRIVRWRRPSLCSSRRSRLRWSSAPALTTAFEVDLHACTLEGGR